MPRTCTIGGGTKRWEVEAVAEYRSPVHAGSVQLALLSDGPGCRPIYVEESALTDTQTTKRWDWAEAAEAKAAVEVSDGEDGENGSHHAFLDAYHPGSDYPFKAYKMSDCGGPWNFKHCRLIAQDPDKWLIEED